MSDSQTPTSRRQFALATAMAYGLTIVVALATYIPLYWALTTYIYSPEGWDSLAAVLIAGSVTLVVTAVTALMSGYRYVAKLAPGKKFGPVLATYLVSPLISLSVVGLVRPWSTPALLLLAAFPVMATLWVAGLTRARALVATGAATAAILTVGLVVALGDQQSEDAQGYHEFNGPLAAIDGTSLDLSQYGLGSPRSVARTGAEDDHFWVRWRAIDGRELNLQFDTRSVQDTGLCRGTYPTNTCTTIGRIPEGVVYSNDGEWFLVNAPGGHWQLQADPQTLTEAQALQLLDSLEPVDPDTFADLALEFPPF